jgi:hypothetical protein
MPFSRSHLNAWLLLSARAHAHMHTHPHVGSIVLIASTANCALALPTSGKAPIFYVIYNRRSIIDGVVDSEFATLDVDNSNSIDANEFYIAVLQMYLKVNRITTILPPKYLEIRRYFDANHEMDRKEFKAAVAILIDTTLKRVLASLVLTFCTPWIAPHIVDIAAFALNPLIYAADMSTCGHAVVVVIGTLINRQLFTTITSVLLVLIALPRVRRGTPSLLAACARLNAPPPLPSSPDTIFTYALRPRLSVGYCAQ